jgi:alkaline phosphatase/alkaline phosphatase D
VFLKHGDAAPEHLYTNAIQPYLRAPHLLLGFPTRFQPKTEQVEPILISSRDGLNFKRWPEALIPITAPQDRDGNRSNYMTYGLLQLPGHSDTLSVYGTEAYYSGPGSRVRRFTFRTDGFVSVRATGDAGELVTPAITFSGDRLNLNYVTHDNGSLKVEVQDADGTALPGFELSQCDALHGDAIDGVVEWSGNSDVGSLAGQSVRLRFVLTNADLFALKFSPGQADNPAAAVHHAQGEMSGEVTSTSVLLQSRLTAIPGPVLDDMGDVPGATGEACFEWSESATFETSERTDWFTATAEADFTVRAQLAQLKPGTVYYYRLIYGPDRQHTQAGPIRHFKTLPLAQSAATVQFCMGSCMNYNSFTTGKSNGGGPVTATAEDKQLGYPVFAAMTRLQPDFFIGTGDIVYYDHPHQTAAQTLPELRKKWHEQFRYPRLIEFFGQTAAFWSKDDHDFRFNDADLQGQRLPDAPTGIGLFREQLPIHAADDEDSPTYRTHRLNQHVQLWFVEGRDYRSPNRMPDGPDKTIWGAEQRKWLQDTLKASDATWKIIISPTPMVGPDRASKKDNHTNPAGFRHEGESFFAWLNDNNVDNVLTFCGDRHWQYHSIHPSGVEEFCCGALNDENSIRGVKPGAKGSTDPDGLIKQPYLYSDPTGGFLHVTAEQQQQPTLTIRFYDDTGRMMHEVVRESVAER